MIDKNKYLDFIYVQEVLKKHGFFKVITELLWQNVPASESRYLIFADYFFFTQHLLENEFISLLKVVKAWHLLDSSGTAAIRNQPRDSEAVIQPGF